MLDFEVILESFFPHLTPSSVESLESGHINDTYRVDYHGEGRSYVLQKINTKVFSNPWILACNHLRLQEHVTRSDNRFVIPQLIQDKNNSPLFVDSSKNYWRLTTYIPGIYVVEKVSEPRQAFEVGRAFGWLNRVCSSLDPNSFVEAIPQFHSIAFRLKQLRQAIRYDKVNRVKLASDEIVFYLKISDKFVQIEAMVKEGNLPLRVVHNDTKSNNVLFRGDEAIAVVDLDKVGPGLLFYDFGVAIRTIGNTAYEDEQLLSKVDFNMQYYSSFVQGYLDETKLILEVGEWNYLHLAPSLMTFIIGCRFLADYLAGDVYFKTGYPEHNLGRARTQMRLLQRMEELGPGIAEMIRNYNFNRETFMLPK